MRRYLGTWTRGAKTVRMIEADDARGAAQVARAHRQGWALREVDADFTMTDNQAKAIGGLTVRGLAHDPTQRASLLRHVDGSRIWTLTVQSFREDEPPRRFQIAPDGAIKETTNLD
jgi:hypothetical protein